jgi:hypothetical protein
MARVSGVTAVALLVYLLTLAPDLTWANAGSDGGELITAAVTLGIPHPPGYPTYVLLGHLFGRLPLGTVAYRFNLFSAVAVALAAGLVTAVSYRLLAPGDELPANERRFSSAGYSALATGLTFAFAPLVWSQAVVAEVYGLNVLAVAAFLWALLAGRPIRPLLTGGLLGISFTTHLTSLLLLPLALALIPWRHWGWLAAGVLVGLLPVAVLPWLAGSHAPVVWGDPTSLSGWWWLVSGRLYQPNLFALPTEQLGPRLLAWSALLLRQFAWVGLPLMATALVKGATPGGRWVDGLLLATATLYFLHALTYNTPDAAVFLLPALLLLTLFLAPALRRAGPAALLLPLVLLLLNFREQNLSGDGTVRPLARQLLQRIPPDAILLTPGDRTIFTLWYFQHVEGQRPDVILVDENLFAFDWYRARLQQRYPDLLRLAVDDVPGFVAANSGRSVIRATLIPVSSNQYSVFSEGFSLVAPTDNRLRTAGHGYSCLVNHNRCS